MERNIKVNKNTNYISLNTEFFKEILSSGKIDLMEEHAYLGIALANDGADKYIYITNKNNRESFKLGSSGRTKNSNIVDFLSHLLTPTSDIYTIRVNEPTTVDNTLVWEISSIKEDNSILRKNEGITSEGVGLMEQISPAVPDASEIIETIRAQARAINDNWAARVSQRTQEQRDQARFDAPTL